MNTTMMITGLLVTTVFDEYVSSTKDYLFSCSLIFFLILLFALLLFKPFRDKYGSVKSALIFVVIANVIFVADNFINNIRI